MTAAARWFELTPESLPAVTAALAAGGVDYQPGDDDRTPDGLTFHDGDGPDRQVVHVRFGHWVGIEPDGRVLIAGPAPVDQGGVA